MSALSESEREMLAALVNQPAWCVCGDSFCAIRSRTERVVDQIANERVRAALEAAANEIAAELICCDVFERLHDKYASEHTDDEKRERRFHAICYWAEASARIVRAAMPT